MQANGAVSRTEGAGNAYVRPVDLSNLRRPDGHPHRRCTDRGWRRLQAKRRPWIRTDQRPEGRDAGASAKARKRRCRAELQHPAVGTGPGCPVPGCKNDKRPWHGLFAISVDELDDGRSENGGRSRHSNICDAYMSAHQEIVKLAVRDISEHRVDRTDDVCSLRRAGRSQLAGRLGAGASAGGAGRSCRSRRQRFVSSRRGATACDQRQRGD